MAARKKIEVYEDELEELKEAARLLDLVNAEFRSDPMSVQCFELRIVKEVSEVVDKINDRNRG